MLAADRDYDKGGINSKADQVAQRINLDSEFPCFRGAIGTARNFAVKHIAKTRKEKAEECNFDRPGIAAGDTQICHPEEGGQEAYVSQYHRDIIISNHFRSPFLLFADAIRLLPVT